MGEYRKLNRKLAIFIHANLKRDEVLLLNLLNRIMTKEREQTYHASVEWGEIWKN